MADQRADEGFVRILRETREAEQFIRDLYSQRRPHSESGKPDANGKSLAKALRLLSSELYTKTCHFLLELVQNADDADYPPGVEPHLSFVLRQDGFLWVGSNEAGFTRDNVEAICDLAGSTKSAKDHQKGFIGEKGIGFKSVFKVADCVWIFSLFFQFRLGREGLDMISPVWENFRHTKMLNERTMFCLHIPEKTDMTNVMKEMLGLKPELLLFLRKLRKISVVIADDESHITHQFSLHRLDNTNDLRHGYTTTQLTRTDLSPAAGTSSEELAVFRHIAQEMPVEAKRVGIKQSEIVLAFPLGTDNCSRPTFNYLPIRDYGFTFLLQADFITTVNREDINQDNDWNNVLLSAATYLFVQCIKTFTKPQTEQMQAFQYTWPRFIKSAPTGSDTVMAKFLPELRKRLMREPVLVSQYGDVATPASLVILGERWLDRSALPVPLLAEPDHLKLYVSQQYDPNELAVLAVKTQTPHQFAALLKNLSPEQMQQKSGKWHSILAEAMLKSPPVPPATLLNIKMVPLRNGDWVAMGNEDPNIYFPQTTNNVHIPGGIETKVVESSASEDPHRRALFKKLKIQDLDHEQVCGLIMKRHNELPSPTTDLTIGHLIEHAYYLFQFQKELDPKYLKGFKFAIADSDRAVSGNELYMNAYESSDFQMSSIFPPSEDCMFVHSSYFHNLPHPEINMQPWYNWLQSAFEISTKPKLAIQQGIVSPLAAKLGECKYVMHPLFQQLVDLPTSMIWLRLLRDQWHRGYKQAADLLPKNCLQQALVTCKDGQRRPLSKVYLATAEILREPCALMGVDLISGSDHSRNWYDLDGLGLKRKPDLTFYLAILRKAAKGETQVGFDDVLRLMQGIQAHALNNESIIRHAFNLEKLVALPNEGKLSWVALKHCMWKAPKCLSGITALADHYSEVEPLFTGALEVLDATSLDVYEALDARAGELTEIENIKALLTALSDLLADQEGLGDSIQHCRGIAIFPVRQSDGSLDLLAADDDTWLVADDRRHQMCFQNRVALLDFPILAVPRLMPLLRHLGADQKALSCSISEEVVSQGINKLYPKLSTEIQLKAGYISLLVPAQHKIAVESQLRNIQVHAYQKILRRRFVLIGSKRVYGNDETAKAEIIALSDPLRLHCLARTINMKRTPWFFVCETMAKIFHIPETHQQTLMGILTTSAGPLIENILSIKGLWDDPVSDIDDVDEDDEPEDEPDEVSARSNKEVEVVEIDDQPDDCRLVSPRSKSDASSEDSSEHDDSSEDDDAHDPSQTAQVPPVRPKPVRVAKRLVFKVAAKGSASLSEVRAANKAEREQKAITQVAEAAADYDLTTAHIYLPSISSAHAAQPFTGLTFQEVGKPPNHDDRTLYHGELFVRGLLNSHFGGTDDAWTSAMRTRQDLGKLEIQALNASSTFTVLAPNVVNRITNWLDEDGQVLGTGLKYHIFVKSTNGGFDEPFSLTNEEFELIKDWTLSDSDVALIFRVYDIKKNPRFIVLVDPINLMLTDMATMTAMGGFLMYVK